MDLTLAYSPCPNDTFMFHALATGGLRVPGHELEVHLHDVETLNQHSLVCTYDFTKLSFYAYLQVTDNYTLLRSGAALGYGCGPLLVAPRALRREDLANCRIAIPGEMTTAHLLFQLWAPERCTKVFVPYDRILPEIAAGRVDCGIIIHESRFVFERAGLRVVADLGEWWTGKTGLPIPLGCIAARRALPPATVSAVEAAVRASVERAREKPRAALDYARQFAQELDTQVLEQHVETFVNETSLDLGAEGLAAVRKLEALAEAARVVP